MPGADSGVDVPDDRRRAPAETNYRRARARVGRRRDARAARLPRSRARSATARPTTTRGRASSTGATTTIRRSSRGWSGSRPRSARRSAAVRLGPDPRGGGLRPALLPARRAPVPPARGVLRARPRDGAARVPRARASSSTPRRRSRRSGSGSSSPSSGCASATSGIAPSLAGALLGFAFLAKYTALLLVPGGAALRRLLGADRGAGCVARRSTRAALVALVLALPVIVWNQTRGWPSLQLHLVERADRRRARRGREHGQSAGGHLVVRRLRACSRASCACSWGSSCRTRRCSRRCSCSALWYALTRAYATDDRDLFLTAFTWPVLLPLLAAMTKFHDAEQHWTMMAFVPAAIAAGRYGDEYWSRAQAPARARRWPASALSGVRSSSLERPRADARRSCASSRPDHYDPRADMVNELVGWDQVRDQPRPARRTPPAATSSSRATTTRCAGACSSRWATQPPVFCPTARRSAFDFFERRDPPADATVIALTTDIHPELPGGLADRTCTVADQVDVERGGRQVARYFVQSCPPVPVESQERASR